MSINTLSLLISGSRISSIYLSIFYFYSIFCNNKAEEFVFCFFKRTNLRKETGWKKKNIFVLDSPFFEEIYVYGAEQWVKQKQS